jgi:hypothetical protein
MFIEDGVCKRLGQKVEHYKSLKKANARIRDVKENGEPNMEIINTGYDDRRSRGEDIVLYLYGKIIISSPQEIKAAIAIYNRSLKDAKDKKVKEEIKEKIAAYQKYLKTLYKKGGK